MIGEQVWFDPAYARTHFAPIISNTYDLGKATFPFRSAYLGTSLVFTGATTKIIPGATNVSFRNNADSADNLLITDAGVATFRSTVQPASDNAVNLGATALQFATVFVRVGLESASAIKIKPSNSESLQFDSTGIRTNLTTFRIYSNTADGSNNAAIFICSGDTESHERGANFRAYGNEHGSAPGYCLIQAGNTASASSVIELQANGTLGTVGIITQSLARVLFNTSGDVVFNATNGGNLIISRSGKGILLGKTSQHTDVSGVFGPSNLFIMAPDPQVIVGSAANSSVGALFYLLKSRATDGSADTILQDQDQVFNFSAWGADGAAFRNCGAIILRVDGTPASNDIPSKLEFQVRAAGAGAAAVALSIKPSRWLEIANTAGAPGSNPTGGGYLYVESGALKYRGSSGTATTLAAA